MARKIEIPGKGKIPVKICVELASDCEKLGFQMLNLARDMDQIIPDDADARLIALRDAYFKKYFGIISGHLKNTSKEVRGFVFGEIAEDEQGWAKVGKDSERLAFFAHNILNAVEVLVPDENEDLKKLLDENFRKILLVASGVLKTVSYAIRNKKNI
jgi:hypothetical protein